MAYSERNISTLRLLFTHIVNPAPGTRFIDSRVMTWDFPGGSVLRVQLPMQEMWVQSLDQEDPLEKEMATHSSILAWRIPWTEEPGGLQSMGSQRVRHN